jgi:pyrroline-5-carboxylate reductase
MEKENQKMKLGFIGIGNMAGAILHGIIKSGTVPASEIIASDISQDQLTRVHEKEGIHTTTDNARVLNESDIVVLAVKPFILESVLHAFYEADTWNHGKPKMIISIVAAWEHERLMQLIPKDIAVLNVLPNTPALVGEGVTAFNMDANLSKDQFKEAERLFSSFGRVEYIKENLIPAFSSICGSGPAYYYMFIEALADAAVADGIPREQAYRLAAQTAVGSGQMVLESGAHPGALKDAVCSPRGATIQAVKSLELSGMRGAVMQAVEDCTKRFLQMIEESAGK